MKKTEEMIKVMQAHLDGKPIECTVRGDKERWTAVDIPVWDWASYDYRVAIEKPSIDWSHVDKQFNHLSRGRFGRALLHELAPFPRRDEWESPGKTGDPSVFSSYKPGNCHWMDSRISRPGFEDEKYGDR